MSRFPHHSLLPLPFFFLLSLSCMNAELRYLFSQPMLYAECLLGTNQLVYIPPWDELEVGGRIMFPYAYRALRFVFVTSGH